MRICICYDLKEDYCLKFNNKKHLNFNSLKTIVSIKNELENCSYDVFLEKYNRDFFKKLINNEKKYDLFLPINIGVGNRNKQSYLPSLLESLHFPYIGSDPSSLALCMDKELTKILAIFNKVKTPSFYSAYSLQELNNILLDFDIIYPCVIKPNEEGSSNGVFIVKNKDELIAKAQFILEEYHQKFLIEEYIKGRDITVSVVEHNNELITGFSETVNLDGTPLSLYTSEYKHLKKCKKIKPILSLIQKETLINYSKIMFEKIPCKDFARFDFRINNEGVVYFLEATPHPMLPKSASFMQGFILEGFTTDWIYKCIVNNTIERYKKMEERYECSINNE